MNIETLWDRWGDMTRFLESTRIAFARERRYWREVPEERGLNVPIEITEGPSLFVTSTDKHLETVGDETTLYRAVLVFSYALAEAAALDHLGLDSDANHGGIEIWGSELLKRAGHDWSDLEGGKADAVEAAVARNLAAHGTSTLGQGSVNRLRDAGCLKYAVHDTLPLDYWRLDDHRARLRALLRVGGLNRTNPEPPLH